MTRIISFVMLVLVVLGLAACSQEAGRTPAPPMGLIQGGPVEDAYDDAWLVDRLRAAGATVDPGDEVQQPFFSVTGRLVKVNGADVQVFAFESEDAAKEEAALVAPNGGSVGSNMMSWIATPHFYRAGKLLVLYVGDDGTISDLLEGALGPQFAGGMPAAAAPGSDGCPATTADTRLLTDAAHGYCALYPAAYDVQQPNPDETVLVVGSLLNVEQPRVYIAVQAAAGRSAAQVADEIMAGFDPGLFNIARSRTTVAGVEAIVLDQLPGQDLNRVVVMVHGERLYTLTFTPADESLGDVFAQLDALYTTVLSSFRFLPPSVTSSERGF